MILSRANQLNKCFKNYEIWKPKGSNFSNIAVAVTKANFRKYSRFCLNFKKRCFLYLNHNDGTSIRIKQWVKCR